MLDARYWILDTGYWILDTGCLILDTRYSILDARYWLAVGFLVVFDDTLQEPVDFLTQYIILFS